MLIFYLSILLTIISNVLYHLFQKLIPQGANPGVTLALTYATAFLACAFYLVIFPPAGGLVTALKQTNWTSAALGLSIIGLEFGFLVAYRSGWNISVAGIVSATGVALILIPIGILGFKEKLSPLNAFGIVLCLAGLILINLKK
jgi:multidrug transporter EmrE-like cation transporter